LCSATIALIFSADGEKKNDEKKKYVGMQRGEAFLEIRIDRICAEDVLRSFLFLVSRFDNRLVLWPFFSFPSFFLSRSIFVVIEGEKKTSLITVHNTPDDIVRSVCVCVCSVFRERRDVLCCVVPPPPRRCRSFIRAFIDLVSLFFNQLAC
jgi:hypothetical protein